MRRPPVRAVVVALGKIGLPLAAQIARAGHEVVGCDVDPRVVDAVNAGRRRRSPARRASTRRWREVVGDGRLRAQTDTAAAVAEGAGPRRRRPAARRRRAGAAGLARSSTPSSTTSAAGCEPRARPWRVETTLPVGTTRERIAPALERAQRPARRGGLLLRLQPRARLQRPRVRRPGDLPQARRRPQRRRARRAASSCTAQFLDAEVRRDGLAPRRPS